MSLSCTFQGCERSFELSRLQALPVRETILTIYPRLFALHKLRADDGMSVEVLRVINVFIAFFVNWFSLF